jgi:hypothetical protein
MAKRIGFSVSFLIAGGLLAQPQAPKAQADVYRQLRSTNQQDEVHKLAAGALEEATGVTALYNER